MKTTSRLLAAALLVTLAACGNKGPLVLPDAPAAEDAAAEPAVEPAPAATQQDATQTDDPAVIDTATTGEQTPPVATPPQDDEVPVQEGDPAPTSDDGTP